MDSSIITKLNEINQKFYENELRMRPIFLKLEQQTLDMKENGLISDFEIDIEVDAYTNDSELLIKYKIEEGNPIYKSVCLTGALFKDEEFMNGDWSEYKDLGFKMCYSMHDFLYHNTIDYQDLLKVEFVYFDIKIFYQFLLELKDKNEIE